MTNILITIAIPAYNNQNTIRKTIESCINQNTTAKYEILIVDDASTDDTPNIIKSYDDEKIRLITLAHRVPLIENHNVCLENAIGKYVIFCHADDALEDHTIEIFSSKLKQRMYPKKYIVWGHSMFRDFSSKAMNSTIFQYNEIVVGEYAPMLFLYGGLTPTGTCYSRESFLELGSFLEVEFNASPSDMTTMIYLAMHGFRFEMIDEMVLNRAGSSTAIQEAGETRYLEELDDAFKYFLLKVDSDAIKNLISKSQKQKVKPLYFYYAITQKSDHKKQIQQIIIREIIKNPFMIRSILVRKLLKRLFWKNI
ncbi:MAG TPA: glycosyltransferase family 2 protein [Arcobacter sp.]|nr:glycosyltransferase family 2 protein [Arcobacter sp.]